MLQTLTNFVNYYFFIIFLEFPEFLIVTPEEITITRREGGRPPGIFRGRLTGQEISKMYDKRNSIFKPEIKAPSCYLTCSSPICKR